MAARQLDLVGADVLRDAAGLAADDVGVAQRVVQEGVASSEDVDQLMMDCFRWPAGPFGMVRGATGGWA